MVVSIRADGRHLGVSVAAVGKVIKAGRIAAEPVGANIRAVIGVEQRSQRRGRCATTDTGPAKSLLGH